MVIHVYNSLDCSSYGLNQYFEVGCLGFDYKLGCYVGLDWKGYSNELPASLHVRISSEPEMELYKNTPERSGLEKRHDFAAVQKSRF